MAKARRKAANSHFSVAREAGLDQLRKGKSVLSRLGSMKDVQADERGQHQDASGDGVEDELDRGVDPVFMPPYADEEEHGDELDLPEEIEEEKVIGQEDAQDPGLHEHQEKVESAHAGGDLFPGYQDAEHGEKGGQQDQHQADPVQAKGVTNAEALDPGQIFEEQPFAPGPGPALEVAGKQTDDERQVAQRDQEARPAAQMRPAGEDQGQQAPQKGKE